jgi:hypothetical protein
MSGRPQACATQLLTSGERGGERNSTRGLSDLKPDGAEQRGDAGHCSQRLLAEVGPVAQPTLWLRAKPLKLLALPRGDGAQQLGTLFYLQFSTEHVAQV